MLQATSTRYGNKCKINTENVFDKPWLVDEATKHVMNNKAVAVITKRWGVVPKTHVILKIKERKRNKS